MASDRIRWNHSRINSDDKGWAGPGIGRALTLDSSRSMFGPRTEKGIAPGPAVLIQFDHNNLQEWVPYGECELLPDEEKVA